VTLVTKEDTGDFQKQHLLMLKEIQDGAASVGIRFNVRWDETIHDRSIRADNGWRILLGRGLDIFQKGSGSQFDIGARRQEFRQVVAFGVTYIRDSSPEDT
jgi:ATP-dependent Lon protease